MIIGAGFWFSNHKTTYSPFKNNPEQQKIVAESLGLQQINKDSDNDGLKDWEEALWKTDPNNPDTDKDGALDGQEIIESRNPLVTGPEDYFEDTQIQNQNSASFPEASSLTEAFSQQFFSEYLKIKQSEETLSEKSRDELINYFVEGAKNLNLNANQDFYTISDIKISPKNDTNSTRQYANNLALIIKKHFDPIPESEMTILGQIASSRDETTLSSRDLDRLNPLMAAYRNTSSEALSLTVPSNLANFHLAIVNSFFKIGENLNSIQKISEDPIQAVVALSQYEQESQKAYSSLKGLNDYLRYKVTFQDWEPANLFKFYD